MQNKADKHRETTRAELVAISEEVGPIWGTETVDFLTVEELGRRHVAPCERFLTLRPARILAHTSVGLVL